MARSLFIMSLAIFVIAGCSGKASDTFRRFLAALNLIEDANLVLLSNSTAENQAACTQGNRVTLQRTFPSGATAYCRDKSTLSKDYRVGETCPGGVNIGAFAVASEAKDCKDLTICGVSLASAKVLSTKSDGGTVDELLFTNLPWGCDARVEYSFDPAFPENATKELTFTVQPPECPFCETQNRKTCLPCTELGQNQQIISGQVILRNCAPGTCRSCPVIHDTSTLVPHGEGKVYYTGELSSCGTKCNQMSLRRVCNDGLWEGNPAYQFPQCVDAICGCSFPGETVTYAHNTSKTIYSSASPACGVECNTQSTVVRCNDGKWETTVAPIRFLTDSELDAYPARTCARRICHCERPNRATVADGQTRSVFSRDLVSCSETCSSFQGSVTCNAGTLTATNPAHLSFAHDSCGQEDCGCRVPLAGNTSILVGNGGSATLYKFNENSVSEPNACTDPSNRITVTCTNRVLSPTYDNSVFRYNSCTTRPLNCVYPSGTGPIQVNHGASLTVSATNTPACGVSCDNLTLYCNNTVLKVGSMSGNTVTQAQITAHPSPNACTPRNCDCTINGFVIGFGQTDPNFYKIDKGTDCNLNACTDNKASLTCTASGVTSSRGDNPQDYRYKSCQVIPCGCPVPWGGTIESGRSVKVFSIDKATCADPNACNNSANFRVTTCTNGVLSAYDTSTFRYPACSPQLCECTWGSVKVPFNQKLRVYKVEVPEPGDTCNANSAEATCQPDGTWTGAREADFPFTSCLDEPDDGIGGGSGGGTGNDEGPGSGIKRRVGLGDGGGGGGGGPCLDFASCRTNITSTSNAAFQRNSCILPWGGGEVEFYGTVAAFDVTCVPTGGKCSAHRQMRTCHFPKWTGSDAFRYPSCEEKATCP